MIPLKDKTNVNAPVGTYPLGASPFGTLRDNPGDNSGTPVNVELVQDIMIWAEAIMAAGGVTPNGVLDVGGVPQLLLALGNVIRAQSATETLKGTAEIATQAETNADTDDERIVTPAKLALRTATETRTGLAEIATLAEFRAATDTTRIVTPDKFGAWFSSTPTTSGEINVGTISNQSFIWKIIGKTVHCRYRYTVLTSGSGMVTIMWGLNSISTPITGLTPQCQAPTIGAESDINDRPGVCTIGNGSDFTKMVHRITGAAGVETIGITGTITFEIV